MLIAECHIFSVILSVIMLSAIMENVVAPFLQLFFGWPVMQDSFTTPWGGLFMLS